MIVEIWLCAHSCRSQLIYVTFAAPDSFHQKVQGPVVYVFAAKSAWLCDLFVLLIYCILLLFTRETERLDCTDEFIFKHRYFSLFLLLTTSKILNSASRPVARTFPWHARGKQLFLCLPHESLFTGDLLTAKELLAQMKYFTNIEEKVKDRITEGCWGKIVIQLSESFTLVLGRLCSRIFIVNGVYLLYCYWYLNKVNLFKSFGHFLLD